MVSHIYKSILLDFEIAEKMSMSNVNTTIITILLFTLNYVNNVFEGKKKTIIQVVKKGCYLMSWRFRLIVQMVAKCFWNIFNLTFLYVSIHELKVRKVLKYKVSFGYFSHLIFSRLKSFVRDCSIVFWCNLMEKKNSTNGIHNV